MRRLFCTILTAAMLAPSVAETARVRGSVRRAKPETTSETLGYTVAQVAGPSKSLDAAEADVVTFLRAKKSGVLPKPTQHLKMTIRSLRIEPEVSACEVDAQVILVNEESHPVTVMIGDESLGVLKPNEERTYTCTAIKGNAESELRTVRVKEWPHMRAAIHIGDLGLVAAPDQRGSFELNAVEGQYVLNVVGVNGPLLKKEVELAKTDVDVGTIDLRPDSQKSEPAPPPAAPPPPKPKRPKPPVEEEEEPTEAPVDEGEAP
jgi:hypothetical protein